MSEAYNKIDGFLRNNLDDSDYEEYSEMLEELYNPSAMLQIQIESLRQGQGKTVNQYRAYGCSDWFDGYPDNNDGGGPYETRTLYTSAPTIPEGWQLLLAELLTVMEIPFDLRKRIKAMLTAAPKPDDVK